MNSLLRAKASMIHEATGNLRAVHLLLGHSKIEAQLGNWVSILMTLMFSPREQRSRD